MNPFGNVATPPDNIGGKNLKPGDIVYHWRNPEIHYQIIGEPRWGKDGGPLMILDDRWDAAEAMKQVKVGFLNKAREEFGC